MKSNILKIYFTSGYVSGFLSILIYLILLLTAGCFNHKPKETIVTGTAAVGIPVVGTVNIKGANGKLSSSTINADGTFTVDVSALTTPFVIYVEGSASGKTVKIYSTIDDYGNVNATPATTAIMALALGDDAVKVYPPPDMKTDNVVMTAAPQADDIESAKTIIMELLKDAFDALNVPAGFDLMNGKFVADGTGFDQALDLINIEVKDDSGNTYIIISDAATGDVYYKKDVETGMVVTDNTENLAEAVNAASTIADDIKTLLQNYYNARLAIDPSRSGDSGYIDSITTIIGAFYSNKYLNGGILKNEAVENDVYEAFDEENEMPESLTVTGVSIIGPPLPYNLIGGELDISGIPNIPNGTYTIGSMEFNPPFPDVIRCFYSMSFIYQGKTETGTIYTSFIKEGGQWLLIGDGSWMGSEHKFSVVRNIYPDYSAGGLPVKKNELKTVLDANTEDNGNRAFNARGINAILVVGEGINAFYTNSGQKGLLYVAPEIGRGYTLINAGSPTGMWNGFYSEDDGLDVAAVNDLKCRYIALRYDSAAKTLTPVHVWAEYAKSKPLSVKNGEITSADFPDIVSPSSIDIHDLGLQELTETNSWTVNFAWSTPSSRVYSIDRLNAGIQGTYMQGGTTPVSFQMDKGTEEGQVLGSSYSLVFINSDGLPFTSPDAISFILLNLHMDDALGRNYLIRLNMYNSDYNYCSWYHCGE